MTGRARGCFCRLYLSSSGTHHPGSLIILRDPENVRAIRGAFSMTIKSPALIVAMSKLKLRVMKGFIQCHSTWK